MDWYISAFEKYATVNGRASRKEYWCFVIFHLFFILTFGFIDFLIGAFYAKLGIGLLSGMYVLFSFSPAISVAVRRLHDTGRTGWWLLFYLIPLIGAIVICVFLVLDSEPKENKYGNNPKP